MKTRFHGDYHLGQVLVAKDDVIIIDFEGEPSRSLPERRHKHSPLRDVVGMLRSLNYAAHAALRQATADRTSQWEVLAPYASDWERRARTAFLARYTEAAQDSAAYPADPGQATMLLDLFTLEKACYELRYELDNRPDWVAIPLGGLCEVLSLETKDVPR
jgi:maltose alpha-D-glucosyltransferase/alpha-amylase